METKKRCTALTIILAVSAAVFALAETVNFVSFLVNVRLLSMWNISISAASRTTVFAANLVTETAIFVLLSVFFSNTKKKGFYIAALSVYAAFGIYSAVASANAAPYTIYMLVSALAAVLFAVNTFMNGKMLTACRISSAVLLAVSSVSAAANIIGEIVYMTQSAGAPSQYKIISFFTALILNTPVVPLTFVLYYFTQVKRKKQIAVCGE